MSTPELSNDAYRKDFKPVPVASSQSASDALSGSTAKSGQLTGSPLLWSDLEISMEPEDEVQRNKPSPTADAAATLFTKRMDPLSSVAAWRAVDANASTLLDLVPRFPIRRGLLATRGMQENLYYCAVHGCRTANHGFKSESQLRKHQRCHIPEHDLPYPCEFGGCNRRFLYPAYLRQHEDEHRGVRYCCPLCGKTNKRFSALFGRNRHFEKDHPGAEKPTAGAARMEPILETPAATSRAVVVEHPEHEKQGSWEWSQKIAGTGPSAGMSSEALSQAEASPSREVLKSRDEKTSGTHELAHPAMTWGADSELLLDDSEAIDIDEAYDDNARRLNGDHVSFRRRAGEARPDESLTAMSVLTVADEVYWSVGLHEAAYAACAASAPSVQDSQLDNENPISLVFLFVNEFLKSMPNAGNFALGHDSASVALLIREYSRLLGNRALDSLEEVSSKYVRLFCLTIARSISQQFFALPDHGAHVSLQEKLGFIWRERPDQAYDGEHITSDDDEDKPARLSVPEMYVAVRFLTESEEFRWLLSRTISEAGLASTGTALTDLRSQLVDFIGNKQQLCFTLYWDPLQFRRDQYGPETMLDIGDVICISGDATNAYADSCRNYMQRMWPTVAEDVLRTINSAFHGGYGHYSGRLSNGHRLLVHTQPGETLVTIAAPPVVLLDVAESIAWMGAACRASPSPAHMASCEISVRTSNANTYRMAYISSESDLGDLGNPKPGTCWHQMFRNPVLVQGFPIPARAGGEQGLEVPLGMMVALGATPDVTVFRGITMLKGFNSLFAPTMLTEGFNSLFAPRLRTEGSIVWHFILCQDGSRLSYIEGASAAQVKTPIEPAALQTSRHFVGWTTVADQLAGSNRSGYTVGWSATELAEAPYASISNVGISITKIVGLSATFVKGSKDTAVVLNSNRVYQDKVKSAGDWTVLFYDTLSRRAWLLDGTSALLHISRAWLVSHVPDLHDDALANAGERDATELSSILDDISSFRWPGKYDGKHSAKLALYNDHNRHLRLWKDDSKLGDWTRWQSIVEEKWGALEMMHDRIVDNRLHPTADVKLPFGDRTLEGYEVRDVVSGTSPLEPRVAELLSSAGNWPKWSVQSRIIPIFGSDFGELIKPAHSASHSHGHQCGRMSLVPTGLDYLAAPVWILEALNRRTSAAETSFISLGNSAFWNDPLACFRKCRCKQGVCPVNVNKLYMGTTKIRKPAPVIPPEAVWKQHSLGAVLFGDARSRLSKDADIDRPEYLMPTRLRRARQQISGSGGDGIASSSSATSFNDSGVYLDPESSSDSGADRKRQCVVLPDARMYSESDAGKGSVRAYVAG